VIASGPLVVDASVAVKWYVPETGSQRAQVVLKSQAHLLAPDLILPEIGNILWKKVRRGELTLGDAEIITAALTASCPVQLISSSGLLTAALQIAAAYDRSVYDSLYLALARQTGCQLVTADERLANSLIGTPLSAFVVTLSQF